MSETLEAAVWFGLGFYVVSTFFFIWIKK